MDQLLPRLPGARDLRWLQGIGHRSRKPQDDARPLPADQEPAGQLQPEGAGLLLSPDIRDWRQSLTGPLLPPERGSEGPVWSSREDERAWWNASLSRRPPR